MNCIITGSNVKILARTVNFFSKIGNELYLEALPTGLSLKAINSMNTAYVVANFNLKFFISFRQGANDCFEENNCKVSIKPVLKIFKSLAKIQICKIWLQVNRMKIVFQFKCKSDILKTHIISLLEHEHINSLRLPEEFPNKIVGDHKVFGNILLHFHNSIDEITFDVKPDETIVSNYIENAAKDRTSMRSTFCIGNSAFKLYDLDSPSNLTFCYKEFKAMAYYADHNRMIVEMNFDQAGAPIMIRMKKDEVLHIHFIIGTMRPRLEKQNRSVQRANRKLTTAKETTTVKRTDTERIDTCHTSFSEDSNRTEVEASNSRLREDDSDRRIELANSLESVRSLQARQSEVPSKRKRTAQEGTFLDGFDIPSRNSTPADNPEPSSVRIPNPPLRTTEEPESYDIVFVGNSDDPNSETQENIPESPEAIADRKRKEDKMRHIFRKCFEATFDPRRIVTSSQVYAENSDPEDN